MANDCSYMLKIVGKRKDAVMQAALAMQYEDFKDGYYLCRIFSADITDTEEKDGFFTVGVAGDCAWSVNACMFDESYASWRGAKLGKGPRHLFKNWRGRDCVTEEFVTIPILCKKLGVGVEIWSKEPGCELQEHYRVDHNGEINYNETVHWHEGWDEDDEGNYIEPNPDKDEGGFDDFGEYSTCEEIYGEEDAE